MVPELKNINCIMFPGFRDRKFNFDEQENSIIPEVFDDDQIEKQ